MTAVAWDGTRLAWDSRATAGDRKHTVKKHRDLKDGRTIVVAGYLADVVAARSMLEGQGLPNLPREITERSNIIVFDNGRVYAYDEGQKARRVRKPDGWGSGQEYVMGALAMGACSHSAVRIACKYSSTCGGKIHERG